MSHPEAMLASLPAQVLRAYKDLTRYLHTENLQAGDRLPPQSELLEILGRNNYTLGAAMQELVQRGVLVRRTGAGTFICDPDAIGPVPWSVGVATIEGPVQGELSVFANLATRLQTRLNRRGCHCHSYSRSPSELPTRLADFGLLECDLAAGQLDGLILLTRLDLGEWQRLRRQGLAVLHLPFWETAPGGVILDQAEFVRQSVHRLFAAGCRHFGVVTVDRPTETPEPRYLQGLAQGLTEVRLPPENGRWLNGRFGLQAGVRLAHELAAAKPADRPDGLIILDDYTAMGLCQALRRISNYRPQICVHTHVQLPLSFGSLPVSAFAVDLEDLVERAIAMFNLQLHRPATPDRLEQVCGVFSDNSEFTHAHHAFTIEVPV